MSDKPSKFYLTTPIYYVNARPHIGHAYTTIAADVIARRQRTLLGLDEQGQPNVWFLTGTDEHGQKVQRSALAAGITPQQFTDEVSAQFEGLWKRMGITYDDYIRTTESRHVAGVQKLFNELYSRGHIYLDTYTGQYSVGEEMFVDGPPGTIGPDGKPTETVTEENFYFRLSAYQAQLIDLIESGDFCIEPEARSNEVLSFLRGDVQSVRARYVIAPAGVQSSVFSEEAVKELLKPAVANGDLGYTPKGSLHVPGALKDLSISRSSFDWGIPVPEPAASQTQKKHVIYVWLDALANYMTAVGYGSDAPQDIAKLEKFWPADLHLVGKEIIRFHCVYWPAFLLAAELPLPKKVQAHGWLLFEESKMSKSRGNIVRTETILDAFGSLLTPATSPSVLSSRSAAEGSASPALPPPPTKAGIVPAGLVKGTASAVPQETSGNAALAAEVSLSATTDEARKHEQDLFGADVLRYFLLREIPFGQDGSFSFDALVQRYNSDLANGYGNLVSRTLALIKQNFEGVIPSPGATQVSVSPLREDSSISIRYEADNIERFFTQEGTGWQFQMAQELDRVSFNEALFGIATAVAQVDLFLAFTKPWILAKTPGTNEFGSLPITLYTAAEAIRIITAVLYPILPYSTAKVWEQLGLGDIEAAAKSGELNNLTWGALKPGTKLGALGPIFPRAPKELIQQMTDAENPTAPTHSKLVDEKISHVTPAPADPTHPGAAPRTGTLPGDNQGAHVAGSSAPVPDLPKPPAPHTEAPASGPFATASAGSATPDTPQIAIDDFVKIDLRVAKVLVAERIPKADKLLRIEVDLGYEKRQILSGIAQWYAPEDLIGRRIVIVANLAPRKMRGLESHGMLLAASHGEDGKPILATFADSDEIELGSRLR
jgi:methionyl-tRNA synthetase